VEALVLDLVIGANDGVQSLLSTELIKDGKTTNYNDNLSRPHSKPVF